MCRPGSIQFCPCSSSHGLYLPIRVFSNGAIVHLRTRTETLYNSNLVTLPINPEYTGIESHLTRKRQNSWSRKFNLLESAEVDISGKWTCIRQRSPAETDIEP